MPYAVGAQAAAAAFLSASFPFQFAVAVLVLLAIIILAFAPEKSEPDEPARLPCLSIFTIFPFFRRRFDFLNWGFAATGQNIFQFQLLNNTVIVVSGEESRKAFFTAKGLDLTEGFKILSGAIPMVKGVTADLQTKRVALIHKRLAAVQRHAPLSDLIPLILEDIRVNMENWGAEGTFDPFDNIYEMVFQTTLRCLSCHEISNDPAIVHRLKVLYDTLDTGTTPTTVLLPWLPFPSMIKKLLATKEIYDIVITAINNRKKSQVYRNDTLQMLLDTGDENLVIVGFIMGLLIAGARATGTTASWLMTFLGGHPEWRDKAAAEVQSLIGPDNSSTDLASLSARLATIPLEAWESQTPVLDAIIKETTRVAQPHTAMRRNLGPEIYIDKKRIPTGAYVVYPFSDVHLNPQLYPDPWKFDPGREEAKEANFSYVGWGGGKTTCLGTRLAKVELKLITAMFVLGYHHKVVNEAGEVANPLPTPNWNDILFCKPTKDIGYIKYRRTALPL
ncbi:Cytochrome P450 [Amanita muscaria]